VTVQAFNTIVISTTFCKTRERIGVGQEHRLHLSWYVVECLYAQTSNASSGELWPQRCEKLVATNVSAIRAAQQAKSPAAYVTHTIFVQAQLS